MLIMNVDLTFSKPSRIIFVILAVIIIWADMSFNVTVIDQNNNKDLSSALKKHKTSRQFKNRNIARTSTKIIKFSQNMTFKTNQNMNYLKQ